MLHADCVFIPVLTSEAGACLTAVNWEEARVTTAVYYLDSLLLKPGQHLLKKIPDLKEYLGWRGSLVLNAVNLIANKEGIFKLISPYDGSKIQFTYSELVDLIQHLKPDVVILPKKILSEFPELWTNWDDLITPFIHVNDLEQYQTITAHGVYFNLADVECLNKLVEQLDKYSHLTPYVLGNLSIDLIQVLKEKKTSFIESNDPAHLAVQGKVYSNEGIVDLADDLNEMKFEPIDAACACPTCSQFLSKAYLYHLLKNTPLLCQRFLIQHNAFFVQNSN